ncbi:MAG: acetolactate synthase large subunit, partial [Burkholderiales bacterium]
GVVTGAADGYARMAGRPAATLLHLGPGLGNGLANLHNARKARTPVLNVVGEHATYHRDFETPLASDTAAIAGTVSHWVRSAEHADAVSTLAAQGIAEARSEPGRIATLILPADAAWSETAAPIAAAPAPQPAPAPDPAKLARAVTALRSGAPTLLFMAGAATRGEALRAAGRLAAHCGCELMTPISVTRIERGAGRPAVRRIPYPPGPARQALAGYRNVIVIGAPPPVSFFGYPDEPSVLTAPASELIDFGIEVDAPGTLEALVEATGAAASAPSVRSAAPVALPEDGDAVLTARLANQVVAALMPEQAIVCDEAVTSLEGFLEFSAGGPQHDLLRLTGGAIGIGIPLATGAAVACPERRVIGLQADGSAMYTVQALWTQARERLNVITVIYANRAYRILRGELRGVGAGEPGPSARRMLDLDDPVIDWVSLARAMGVEAARAETVAGFVQAMRNALAARGPFLIEARI